MKKVLFWVGLVLVLGLSAACIDCVRGSGPMAREECDVTPFDVVNLETSGRVIITPGATYSVTIEAQESLLPYIEAEVEGTELTIRTKRCFWTSEEMYIFIQTPELIGANISGSGSIESDGFFEVDDFEMTISGSGSILMQLRADMIRARISGSGDIRLEGVTEALSVRIAGSGDLRAYDLIANEAIVKVSGSGDARVFANKQLDASIAGSGDVFYRGEPDLRFSVSGSGSVRKSE